METPPDEPLERYRAGYLKLRSVLVDRTTGLPATALLTDRLKSLLETRRHIGVVHVEIANLDLVESLYGWQTFDRIVARVSAVLREATGDALPASTLLSIDGVGGHRFVAFVPEIAPGSPAEPVFLSKTARALQARLEEAFAVAEFAGLNPKLVCRTGHSLLSESPFYRFERRVRAAVEEARTLESRRESGRETSWGEELRRLIQEAAVATLFQPVIDLESGEVLGYEALTRGPRDSVFEMPSTLFALSARFGLAADLDRLCRRTALRESAALAGRGKIFLNALPASLLDPEWRGGGLREQLEAASLEPSDLVIELSERGADADPELFAACFERIKALGLAAALDDVGTGYATLGTLEHVRPDYLKLDVGFVRGVDRNFIKQEMLSSLVQIGRRVGAAVIAEGIESEEETAVLRAIGARYGQGFLFGRPAPAASAANCKAGGETDH